MAGFFSNMKTKFSEMFSESDEGDVLTGGGEEYIDIDTTGSSEKAKVTVRPFTMEEFADIKMILDVLREGSTIALVNIRPLKDKDVIELKRAINKLKKTSDAIGGDIAGFGDDFIVVTPGFARVYRAKSAAAQQAQTEINVQEEAV